MGKKSAGTPSSGVAASARKPASPIRYIPATLASAALLSSLLFTDAPRMLRPWFYGLFLKSKGDPPLSTTTVLVTADPGSGALDAAAASRLAAAVLERGPTVLVIGPVSVAEAAGAATGHAGAADGLEGAESDPSRLESLEALERLPSGTLVVSHAFSGFRPWTLPEGQALAYPPLLSRSLYPLLDGPEPGLELPLGEGLDLADEAIARGPRGAGSPEASTGFASPLSGDGVYSVPAFARLGRGVVAGLGIEAARRALGVPAGRVGYVEGAGVLFNASHVLPIDARGEIPVRFHGPGGITRIPASRFLEGRVSAVEVRGKMVFLDPSAPGHASIGTVAGPRTPTEIQASVAANFMEGALVNAPGWGAALPVVIGFLFIGLLVLAAILDFGASASLGMAVGLALLYPVFAYFMFLKSSLWLPPELPPLMTASAFIPFWLARVLAPSRRMPAALAIQPAPGYDPALLSMPGMGRAAAAPGNGTPAAVATAGTAPVTPYRGTPQVGAQMPTQAGPAQPVPRAQAPRPASIPTQAPSAQPAQAEKPRPALPRERQGAASFEQRAESERAFLDPRDPPVLQQDPNATVDLNPAPPAPRPAPIFPAAPPQTVSAGDDIERDAKGGLIRVGKYRIVRKMGFGSGGDVFEGFDTHMGRKVAIKTITKNASAHFDRAAERFQLEAKAAGALNHPCINTIYDFGTIRDVSYMVLEFLDGITLSQWMRNTPAPPRPAGIAHWLQQICSALDYAHGHKIIHRDLKPSNLMVVNNGGTIKLLDFGIAKMEDIGLTQTGMTVGTPSYMSPEQLSGIKVGPASDQYGLAVVIYQLFTYKLPYVGTKIPELCNRILKNDIIPLTDANPALGAPFWAALKKAMSKQPEDRYPNCLALYAALEAAFPDP
jgi:hypothetical protein